MPGGGAENRGPLKALFLFSSDAQPGVPALLRDDAIPLPSGTEDAEGGGASDADRSSGQGDRLSAGLRETALFFCGVHPSARDFSAEVPPGEAVRRGNESVATSGLPKCNRINFCFFESENPEKSLKGKRKAFFLHESGWTGLDFSLEM